MAKMESIRGEPGAAGPQLERVPLLPKPIAHDDSKCNYVAHQLECTAPVEGLCDCKAQCACEAMTERELHDWLALLRPSRVAVAQAAAAQRSKSTRSRGRDNDAEF